MPTNDNDVATHAAMPPPLDPYGHAALVLVESLIHGLCENRTLSNREAVAIVERAVDVQYDHAVAADGAEPQMWRAHALLQSIAASLQIDADDPPPQGPPASG